jgi:hypothetical protein
MPQQVGKFDFSGIPAAPDFSGIAPAGATPPPSAPVEPSILDKLAAFFPSLGGTVGGLTGGPVGAAIGGTAGSGFQQLAQHATELPGAVSDVARNLFSQPAATLAGGVRGVAGGAVDAATEGALQGALEYGGGLVSKHVIAPVARGVMRGYLKPSLAGGNIQQAREIVQTALDEALPATKAGDVRADRLIADLNKQINSELQHVKGKIDLGAVAQKVRAFAKAKYYKPGVDNSDYRAALEVADQIDKHASLTLPGGAKVTKVNAPIGNDIKQAVRPNSRAYGSRGAEPEAAARKVAGSEMRQSIEDTAAAEGITDIGAKNAREGRIIEAQEAVRRAAGREENKGLNPTAVPNLIAGGLGMGEFARERDPASSIATALAVRAALSPAVMTRAAILATRLAKNGYAPATAARMAVEMARSESEQKPGGNP